MLPFGRDAFLALFGEYNVAIWPAQIVAYALGVAALACAARPFRFSSRIVPGVLVLAWLWNGIAYHLLFFARLNFWAYGFAVLFIVQGLAFAGSAARGRTAWRLRLNAYGWTGLALTLFAMAGYPLLGHGWPRAPAFGVTPCPTTIFTWGLLLMAEPRAPIPLLLIPALWTLIGSSAAFALGMREDLTLLLAGAVAVVLIIHKRRHTMP